MITPMHGARIVLRPLRSRDAQDLQRQVNRRDVVQFLAEVPYPYTLKDAQWFIREMTKAEKKGKDYVFAICTPDDDTLIGVVGLHNIHPIHKHGVLGYWLGKKYWGNGYMTEAVSLMLRFAFSELKLHRIGVSAYTENMGSLSVIRKNGFTEEGIAREKYYRFGKWLTSIQFSMLRKEYLARK